MRILIAHYGMKDKAGFSRNFSIAKGLAKINHDVVLLTTQSNGFKFPFEDEIRNNVKIISFPDIVPQSFRRGGFGFFSTILKAFYVIFHKFDIVQSDTGHRPASGIPCLLNRLFRKSKYISEWWDYYGISCERLKRNFIYRNTVQKYDSFFEVRNKVHADGVVSLSEFNFQRGLKAGIKESNITIIHGGADIDDISFYEDTKYKKQYGIPNESLTFCIIGINDSELEGLRSFINVMSEFRNKEQINWFSIGENLTLAQKIKYGISDNYYEYGWIDYRKDSKLLSCADIFLLIKKDNVENKAGWPNKTGDYLAAGRPILVNKFGNINPYIEKYSDAFIVVENNEESIKDRIKYILENRNNLSKRNTYCRDIAEKYLSWDAKAEELDEFYERILKH
ncbi:MAG: glycosyltransferase [Ignavibacteria bacterium]